MDQQLHLQLASSWLDQVLQFGLHRTGMCPIEDKPPSRVLSADLLLGAVMQLEVLHMLMVLKRTSICQVS